ncbi:MAG: LLM class flavin-dependent oxidoreductase [Solirubrobacteraceae bacterium]
MAPTSLSVRVGVAWTPRGADLRDGTYRRLVEALERIGYDSIWLADTAALEGVAPLPALTAAALWTERLKLGTGVLVLPPRNAVLLARELATLDVLSGGRLLPAGGLGIAAGPERDALGVPRGERVARLEEVVTVVKALWTGDPVTFDGRFCALDGTVIAPVPHRRRLELWLGGTARPALERVGRIADGWLASFIGPEDFARAVTVIRRSADEAGRSIDPDHYGTTVHAVRTAGELGDAHRRLLGLAPNVAPEDHVAVGAAALRELLERFIVGGATKFVVVPVADDPIGWLEELYDEVVAPLEAAGGPGPR